MTDIAATIWQPQANPEGDYASITADNLVDPTDSTIDIIDPSDRTIDVISTPTSFTALPGTIWTESEGA